MLLSQQRRFPRSPQSIGAARTFTLVVLAQWRITDRSEDVRLCVSELATNALLHGVPLGREFCVGLSWACAKLRVEVRDGGSGRPERLAPGPSECSGRGLLLAAELADDFGVIHYAIGKTVRVDFKVSPAGAE
ncbi:ATP-binding protein [Streptomyces sp. NPDC091292]|uniref:ATP-binding protein n=1 Tax=Streptomyces sp. NPDC091292 TaxID=3365991 RepID=UPI0038044D3E